MSDIFQSNIGGGLIANKNGGILAPQTNSNYIYPQAPSIFSNLPKPNNVSSQNNMPQLNFFAQNNTQGILPQQNTFFQSN